MRHTAVKKKKAETVTFKKWDAAESITTKADVIAHLEVAFKYGTPDELLSLMGDLARSKGMTQVARELGVSREGLYRSLAPGGKPSFETVMKLLDILNLRLTVETKTA
jgi:probable addiction module antidote protein